MSAIHDINTWDRRRALFCKACIRSWVVLSAALVGGADAEQPYDRSFFLYLGNDPRDVERDWTEEAQGLSHDDTHWFITQRDAIWRVPVTVDLGQFDRNTQGVRRVLLDDIPELLADRYNHFGDPTHYYHNGNGYLIIAIEGDGSSPHALGAFRGETLAYVDHAYVPEQVKAPWCAVGTDGSIYSSSDDNVSALLRYTVEWNILGTQGEFIVHSPTPLTLRDEDGARLTLHKVQGGVLTNDGTRAYIMADGIHVFDMNTGRRVRRSANGVDPFNYEYDPRFDNEEPEGLTIWDLDGQPSPHEGQLHAMLLNNDVINDDNVWIKHYTHTIRVDADADGEEKGTPENPFRTVAGAVEFAWDGAHVTMRADSYPEVMTIAKRIRLDADGGTARIGR